MILHKILLLLSLLSSVLPLHRYPRQIPSGGCANDNIDQRYDESKCEKHVMCKKPSADLKCDTGYTLHYSLTGDAESWAAVQSSKCEAGKYSISDGQLTVTPAWIVCSKERGCDLTDYPAPSCQGPKEECEKPDFNNNKFTCNPGFQLEAMSKWSNGEWADIELLTCNTGKVLEIKQSGDATAKSGFVHNMRCMKLNGDSFYDQNECETEEICEKPHDWSPVTCKADFMLQVKIGIDWKDVEQASLVVNKFTGTMTGGSPNIPEQPDFIRCVRKKCSTCDNPCPTCGASNFHKSRKWNDCADFKCGAHSRTFVQGVPLPENEENLKCIEGGDPASKWTKIVEGGEARTNGDVTCEILCTLTTPLTTICDANDYLCDTITISDDAAITCTDAEIVHISAITQTENKGSQLQCDKTNGVWKLDKVGGGAAVPMSESGNVICRYKDCDSTTFCPLCVKDASIPGKIQCPANHNIQIQKSPSDQWNTLPISAFFQCKHGKWRNEAGDVLVDTTQVKCDPITTTSTTTTLAPSTEHSVESSTNNDDNVSSSAQEGGLGTVSYILIVLAIILVPLGIIDLVLKLTGKGWLYTIILAKLRGGKKKETKIKGKTAGSPGVSGKDQLNGNSPRANSPGVSGKTTAKEGDEDEAGTETGGTVGNTEGTETAGTENGTTFEV